MKNSFMSTFVFKTNFGHAQLGISLVQIHILDKFEVFHVKILFHTFDLFSRIKNKLLAIIKLTKFKYT